MIHTLRTGQESKEMRTQITRHSKIMRTWSFAEHVRQIVAADTSLKQRTHPVVAARVVRLMIQRGWL
jgi:hypothetical protein